MTTIICDYCHGSGRDTAGHNFIPGGACENCEGQGSWEVEGREIARQQLTTCEGDPLLKRRRAA